ncbi:MAG: POTRA domain-containing protein, partial [Gemmataceae bacterium]
MIIPRPYRLLRSVIVLALGVLVGGNSIAMAGENPQGKIIAEIVPVNNKVHAKENILSQIQSRPGKPYDETTVQEDVRRLISTRWFAPGGVKVETSIGNDGRVTIFISVVELNSVVSEVLFVGAQHMSPDELITLTGIRRGSPLNPAFNETAAQIIQNKYREDGRYFATVTLAEGGKLADRRVVFNIVEGPVVKVSRVRFAGHQSASGGRLATQVQISAPVFGMRLLASKFTPQMLEQDKQKLLDYYHKLGHLEARVQEEVVPSRDLSSVEIVFHVDEGPVYTVREVRLEGTSLFPKDKLQSHIETKANSRYDRDTIQTDIARLKIYYGNRGYNVVIDDQYYVVPNKPGTVDVQY